MIVSVRDAPGQLGRLGDESLIFVAPVENDLVLEHQSSAPNLYFQLVLEDQLPNLPNPACSTRVRRSLNRPSSASAAPTGPWQIRAHGFERAWGVRLQGWVVPAAGIASVAWGDRSLTQAG